MSEEILADETPESPKNTETHLPDLKVRNCLNCDDVLTGAYCMSCGQKDFNMLRPFWTLLEDTLGDLFSFDSRFFGTLVPLFLRPGYITREFNRGRRAKFVPPFRQYLVVSIIFFLLLVSIDVQLFDTDEITFNNSSQTEGADTTSTNDQNRTVDQVLDTVVGNMTKKRDDGLKDATETEKQVYNSAIGLVGGLKKVWLDPKLLNVVLADWIPKLMFLMLPLFAVILKIVYIRRKKYYIEHLVFSMHYHAFLFLLFTIMLLLYHFVPVSHSYLPYLLWYVPIYLFVALWTVYGQGPIKTFFKGLFLNFTYFILITTGLGLAIGYGLSQV